MATEVENDPPAEVQKLWKQFDKHDNFKIERRTQIFRMVSGMSLQAHACDVSSSNVSNY